MQSNHVAPEDSPESEVVVARYRWTLQELQKAYRSHHKCSLSRLTRYGLNFVCGISLIAGAIVVARTYESSRANFGLGLFFVLFSLWWFCRGFTMDWAARRQFRRRPDQNIEIEWRIGPQGIHSQSKLGEARVSWESFVKVVPTSDGFMFYHLENYWHWLPRTAFASDADFERVARWIESNLARRPGK